MPQEAPHVISKNILIALGGNVPSKAGDALQTLRAALVAVREKFGDISASKFYQTPSFPAGSGPDFVNAACLLTSSLAPYDILQILHVIEADFGRERVLRWGQRTLDLDLIAVNDTILPDTESHSHWRTLPMDAH